MRRFPFIKEGPGEKKYFCTEKQKEYFPDSLATCATLRCCGVAFYVSGLGDKLVAFDFTKLPASPPPSPTSVWVFPPSIMKLEEVHAVRHTQEGGHTVGTA